MKEPILKVSSLSVGFKKNLFNELNLEVNQGEFITLMGENGIGKTSLLRCLLGQINPKDGEYSFWGQISNKINRSHLNQKVAWVLSGEEKGPSTLELGQYFNSISRLYKNWDKNVFNSLIKDFDLDLSKKFGEISLGEWSKVKLCRAMSIRPKMIILDELTANLSDKSKEVILGQLISQFSDDKLGILYISHNEEEALRISDKIYELTSSGIVDRTGANND